MGDATLFVPELTAASKRIETSFRRSVFEELRAILGSRDPTVREVDALANTVAMSIAHQTRPSDSTTRADSRPLVDSILAAVFQTHDGSDLWSHARRDPEAFRAAVAATLKSYKFASVEKHEQVSFHDKEVGKLAKVVCSCGWRYTSPLASPEGAKEDCSRWFLNHTTGSEPQPTKACAAYIVSWLRSRNSAQLEEVIASMRVSDYELLIGELEVILQHGGKPPNWT